MECSRGLPYAAQGTLPRDAVQTRVLTGILQVSSLRRWRATSVYNMAILELINPPEVRLASLAAAHPDLLT